jgi:orotidine-5'-phosphate decarboxylase
VTGPLPENPILVALDVESAERAVRLAKAVAPHVGGFKVGLELLMGPGPATVAALGALGKPVFADAKLHDIPSTVGRAASQLGRLGTRWVSVHGAGGRAMLEAAAEGLAQGAGGRPAGLLAITVLTSLSPSHLAEAGLPSPGRLTARLARLAEEAGCEGVVCSPRELRVVADMAPGLRRVTPGIRPAGTDGNDQARTATPEEALRHGADLLVVGRAITGAHDPVKAAAELARVVLAEH